MKKIIKQKSQDEQIIDFLKRITKRVEETTVDIHDIRFDLKSVKLRLNNVESNTEIMKVDTEKIREELVGLEIRLNKRIANVADLITISMDQKFRTVQKRIKKIEQIQQPA